MHDDSHPRNVADLLKEAGEAQKSGQREQALALFKEVLAERPNAIRALNGTGTVLGQLGRNLDSVAFFDRAIALAPQNAQLRFNRAFALQRAKRFRASLDEYDRAIAIAPEHPAALENRSVVLRELKRPQEALAAIEACLALEPENARLLSRRGAVLNDLERSAEALVTFKQALALAPEDPNSLNNCAAMLMNAGDETGALELLEKALAFDPDFAGAHIHRSFAWLRQGDFERGWREYEWRIQGTRSAHRRIFLSESWLGEKDLEGKSILIFTEQGIGDTLQFCRYVPLLAARRAQVALEVPKLLKPLIAGLDGLNELVGEGERLPPTDFHCALASLPLAFGTTLDTVPAATPYLYAQPEVQERWRAKLEPLRVGGKKLVGINWHGRLGYQGGTKGRSAPLSAFLPIAKLPGVALVSLQKFGGLEELNRLPVGMTVETLGDDFDKSSGALVDSAAVISLLDLVITIDTSIAHLAGALGSTVFVALKHTADWRWLRDRDDSPWYPTMRLFRQDTPGDWAGVFDGIAQALSVGFPSR